MTFAYLPRWFVPTVGLIGVATALSTQAAQIVWGTPLPIAGDSDVNLNGALVMAFNFNGPNTTVNGVLFQGVSLPYPQPDPDPFPYIDAGSDDPPFSLLTPAYQELLRSAYFTDNAFATFALGGLVPGLQYEIQLWAHHSSQGYGAYLFQDEEEYFSSVYVPPGSGDSGNWLGSHVTGSFTADGTGIQFSLGAEGISVLNGLQVRLLNDGTTEIPEAETTLAGLAMLLGTFGVWYRRRMTGH